MAEASLMELNERFGTGSKELEPDTVKVLQSIMNMHQLSAEDLYFKWESYCIRMEADERQPSMERLRAFKQDLLDALERSNRAQVHIKTEKRVAATPRGVVRNNDVFGMLDGLTTPGTTKLNKGSVKRKHTETPSVSRVKADILSSSPDFKTPSKLDDQLNSLGALPPSSFNDRANPGEVTEVLNPHLPAAEPPIAPFGESRIKLTAASDQKKLAYKPLAMKLSEASEILDDRIDEFTDLVMNHHKLDPSSFGSAASQSTTEIVAVGRIASDSAEGKLNAASVVLETSRRTGGGLRVPLDLGKLKGYGFFPGQIVAMRGSNASGHAFTVNELLDIPLQPSAASTPANLEAHRERLSGGADSMYDGDPMPLNIIYASGPYTADDNLDFEPLHALCSQAADTYADVLVLTGPFIDVDHPLIASGDFDLPDEANVNPDTATMSTVFKYMISPALNRLVASNPHVTILLVPSVRDVIDKHVSWPQDAFPRRELGLPKTAVKIVGNPMTLSINEAVTAVSSQDIFYHLRHEEVAGGRVADPNVLSRVARYLLEQRHFFPLFPPTDRAKLPKTGTEEGIPPGAMLDVSYLKLGEMVNVRPDVLVVPSALPPFAKVVESVLIINPGYLSKRRGAGTYARMTLYPPTVTDAEARAGQMLGHKVFERARVEITKI